MPPPNFAAPVTRRNMIKPICLKKNREGYMFAPAGDDRNVGA